MAAVSALIFTFLSSGDHLIASEVCYAGSVELFGLHLPRFGIEVSLVDTSDLEQVRAALRPNTKLVYVETPANPILRIADIAALAEIAHEAGALLAVDSTWAGPSLQQPLALGADFVVHSLTKYLNGHGDALGGVVLGSDRGRAAHPQRYAGPPRRRAQPLQRLADHARADHLAAADAAALPERPAGRPIPGKPSQSGIASSIRAWKATRTTHWPPGRCPTLAAC